MDIEKSISFLKNSVTRDSGFSPIFIANMDIVIGYVEEQLNNKPTSLKVTEIDVDYGYFDCPNCDIPIWYGEEYLDHRYCLNCGQKLDWGND